MTHGGPAESLLRSLGIAKPAEIDVEAIAWSVGAKVREGKLESCEARIIGYKDRAIITVRQGGDPRRKRFSIAHELGHWTHHRGHSSICRASEIGNPGVANQVERQADRFAADLLMPRYLFEPSVAGHRRPSFEALDALASEYSTSRIATAMRCVDIAAWPIMLVCHNAAGRRWFKRSELVPERWFPRADLDPSSPSMAVLFGDLDRSRPQIIAADAWFDRRDASGYRVTEQSVKALGGEMLTLLAFNDPKMLS
ncbi:ImmA/IrrE family metallo-endopeptidase [Sphingobium sp. CR28]|uniref:ImmA/IrrE family metallo-endopeptidase n=1 Tax=Sphingobium sp. CR28 TaxID=3400272 RepID=UPI003FEFC5CE